MGGRGGTSTSVSANAGYVTSRGQRYGLDITATKRAFAGNPKLGDVEFAVKTLAINDGDRLVGMTARFNDDAGSLEVRSIDNLGIRGQGIAQRLYAAGIEKAKQLGYRSFASDSRVSASADAAWRRLADKLPSGSIERNKTARSDDTQTTTENGQPVWSVNVAKVPPGTARKIKQGRI